MSQSPLLFPYLGLVVDLHEGLFSEAKLGNDIGISVRHAFEAQ